MPFVMRLSSAVTINLSLLTADLYSLLFGLILFSYKVEITLRPVLLVVSVVAYYAFNIVEHVGAMLSHIAVTGVIVALLTYFVPGISSILQVMT